MLTIQQDSKLTPRWRRYYENRAMAEFGLSERVVVRLSDIQLLRFFFKD